MWILPTRERPHNLQRLIGAWYKTGASTPVELCVDINDPCWPQYESMVLPTEWHLAMRAIEPLSKIYNAAYQRHPNESFYGFIADDVVPTTKDWDRKLIETAGLDGMAVPAGGETTGGCPHFVLGGNLVRSIGWLALPGLQRLFIDTCWGKIASSLGVLKHCPNVILEHRHFSNHLALFDATYRKSTEIKKNDRRIYEQWLNERREKS